MKFLASTAFAAVLLAPAALQAQTAPAAPAASTPPAASTTPAAPAGSATQAAPAAAAAPAVGATIYDSAGAVVGTIDQITPQAIVVTVDNAKVSLPPASVGPGPQGLRIALTRAEVVAAAQQAQAGAQQQLLAQLTPGASVRGAAGSVVGTVKSADAQNVTLTTPKGDVQLPMSGFAVGANGPVIGLTSAQLDAALAQAGASAPAGAAASTSAEGAATADGAGASTTTSTTTNSSSSRSRRRPR